MSIANLLSGESEKENERVTHGPLGPSGQLWSERRAKQTVALASAFAVVPQPDLPIMRPLTGCVRAKVTEKKRERERGRFKELAPTPQGLGRFEQIERKVLHGFGKGAPKEWFEGVRRLFAHTSLRR